MTPGKARSRRTASTALCLAAVSVATGCFYDGGGNVEDLPRMPRAEAMRMADEYANRTVALVGAGVRLENPDTLTPPCDGPGGTTNEKVYYAAGHYQIVPVQAEQQLTMLRRLRDQFQQQGYTIKQDRVFPDGKTGTLIVQNPADEFEIAVTSTDPPSAFALSISSPCYFSDEPYPAPLSPSTED